MVDLFSDTVTRPTPGMRRFISEAEVGDEQLREDPTVNLLQDIVADLLGKEAALFLPSGTMCNQIAFAVHCRAGDEILLHETGASSAVRGRRAPRPWWAPSFGRCRDPRHVHGRAGAGRDPPASALHAPKPGRLDRADRPTSSGASAGRSTRSRRSAPRRARRGSHATWTAPAFSTRSWRAERRPAPSPRRSTRSGSTSPRGSAPRSGAVLAGSRDFIEEAWVFKQRYGGAMRQAGILAAAGLYALEHHVERLAEDHERARRLALGLAELRGIAVTPSEWTPTS